MATEDNLREIEIELKKYEAVNKSWELYNDYAKDLRLRIDGVIKSVLLTSGGALTVSAGIFLRQDRPMLYPELIPVLQNSWLALGTAMILMIALVVHVILVTSLHADRWQKALEKPGARVIQPGKIPTIIGWVLGLVGIACCFTGIGSLLFVARSML